MDSTWTGRDESVRLLSPALLVKTGDVDHASWNYEGVLGTIARRRFRKVVSLLPNDPVDALLEVGFGSGVFMPELSLHTKRLDGADVHGHTRDVETALLRAGVHTHLVQAPAEHLPFEDASFDAVVVVSAFEFVTDPVRSAHEMARVLRPDGCAIVVTPGSSPLLDLALRVLTGADAKKDFQNRRELVIPALLQAFTLDKMLSFPRFGGPKMYRALRLVKR